MNKLNTKKKSLLFPKMTFQRPVDPRVFRAVQNVDIATLSQCTEQQIRPVLPCLVRMSLISPLDTSGKCSKQKMDILTITSGIEIVNSIVAFLSIDFHMLEGEGEGSKAQERAAITTERRHNTKRLGFNQQPSFDMTRRLRLVLSELLFIQSQISESENGEMKFFVKQSELFDNDIYIEEISDIICIALAELPTLLNVLSIAEILIHVHNGPAIICRVLANFPDSFREGCTNLFQCSAR